MPIIVPQKTSLDVYDIVGARKAGVPEEEISSYLKNKFNPQYDFDGASKSGVPLKDINDHILGKLNNPNPIGNTDLLKKGLVEGKDRVVDGSRPIVDSLAVGAGGAAGSILGPAGTFATGASAGILSDTLMQAALSPEFRNKNRSILASALGTEKEGAGETLANSIENISLNELMGKIFNKIGSKGKALTKPTVDPALESLKPTFSQYGDNPKSISSMIENIWNPGGKSAALNNSADLARGQVRDLVKKVSGRSLSTVPDITNDVLGKDVQNISRISVDNLNSRFDDGRKAVETIGKLNSAKLPPDFTPVQSNGFLNDPADKTRYLNNAVSGIKDSHYIGSNNVPLQTNVNGSGLNLYKSSTGQYVLGQDSPGVGIKIHGKIQFNGNKGIENLAIDPAFQNKGLAQILIKTVADAGFPIKSVQGNGLSQDGANAINKFIQGNAAPKTIEAPIQLNNTVKAAEDFLKEKQKFYGNQGFQSATDSDKKLITQAQTILSHTNNGTNPIPYRDAMDLFHGPNGDGGLSGMSSLKPGELNQTKSIQSQFADSLHNDIESSISKWNDPGKTALKGYQDSRVAAETKKLLYEGGNVKQLVENVNSPISQIDSALKDPIQTQRLLNASQFNGLKSQNMRQDLAGYRLNQIWQKADNGAKGIDGNALLSEWNNPEMAKTKDLLYSKQTQDQIGEFFNNVNKVSQSGVGGNYQKIRMTMRGLELSSSLFTGIVSGNPLHGLNAAGGFAAMELPMLGVAKILSNPARAQILQKLITGAPLEASEAQAGRLLMSGLNGMTVGLLNSKGEKVNVQVRDGKVE